MRFLVTGAAGFIGSEVCRQLAASGEEVVAVDMFLPDSYSIGEKKRNWKTLREYSTIRQVVADLRDDLPLDIFDQVDVVINEAGMPGLTKSWTDFSIYSSCNVEAVSNLLDVCKATGVAHFVQISTSSVYGQHAKGDESTPVAPISPYGVTKLAAEELLKAHSRVDGTPFTILRYFSVYGPGQRPDMAYRRIIERVRMNELVQIFGDGHQSRSNTFVGDCARATILAAQAQPLGETFNICGSEKVTLLEAVEMVEQIMGKKAKLQFLPGRRGDQRETFGDASKAQSLLGFTPVVPLDEGLDRQVAWQLSNG